MPIKVKDHGKCKEWEQRRRDRLNDAFKNLAQLLPHYDPAKIPAKIEILDKSTEFVKELRLSNSRLLSSQAENDEKCKLIKELQDEVNKLILRVKQLTILLKKANITIPTGPEIKSLGSRKQKWSGKLKPEDVENSVIILNESTTKAGTPSSQKDCLAKEGAVSISNDATPTSTPTATSVSVASPLVSSNILGISPNPGGRSQGPPIIIPLKETNSIKACPTTTSTSSTTTSVATSVISTSPLILSSPQKTATLLTVSSSSSPTRLISSEPIFTTSSPTQIQLPLQTFILAPCPISGATTAYPTAPQSQFLTRIALHTPLLPKPLDGISFQKIPIKSVLKPIPKIIRRRRKRTKKVKEPQIKLTAKSTNTTNDAGTTTEPVSNLEEPSNKSKDGAASTKEVEEIRDVSASVPIEIPGVEKGGKARVEPSIEKDKEDVSTQEKVKNPEVSSGETLTGTSVGPSNTLETTILATNTAKEAIDHQQTVAETPMEVSDNIPVLRIIETGAVSEESGPGLTGLFCNVISTDKSKSIESVTIATENGANIQQITNEAMEDDSHPTTEAALSKKESIAKGTLESSNIPTVLHNKGVVASSDPLAGNTKDIVTSPDNFPPKIVEAGASTSMPSISTAVDTEKVPQSEEQSQQESTRKRKQTVEKAPNVMEKCSEPNNMEVEMKRPPAEFVQLPLSSSNRSNVNISVVKSRLDDSNSRIETSHEPEVVKAVNPSTITATSAVREDSLNTIVVIPEPIIPESLSPPKAKEVPSTSSSTKVLPSLHQELMDTSDTVTTTDKISECIARSIDLIDANDSELMELGDHWEDTGGSPKSPISPTQMFLNMFPLLPRESTVSDHHSQPQLLTSQPQQHSIVAAPTASHHHKSSIPPFTVSSSSRSSFFIDAMLPEDHSTSNTGSIVDEMGIVSSSHVAPCLAMTPPQYSASAGQHVSSPFSLSSNYYWTPATASCTVDNSFDYRPTSTIIPPQHINNGSSSSGGATTTFTLSSSGTTKSFSTFSTVTSASASNAFFTKSTIPSIATSNSTATTPSSKSSSQVGKSGKSSKVSKQLPIPDSNFHPLLTKVSKPTTTSTVATTSVTWSLSAPTQSVSSYSHNHSSSATSVQPQSAQNPVPSTQVHFSHHGGATATPSSTCSLLDSLNPMDASFFRPLINALDAHDFRTLDFTSGNPLPPPLPPLIPPVPPTPLFTTQINSNATPTSHPNVSYHTPTVSSHEPLIPALQSSLIHHHPSSNIFGSTTQQSAIGNNTPSSNIGGSKKQQNAVSHVPPVAVQQNPAVHIPPPAPTSTKHRSNTSGADKTSKTSGRQKAETSKQSRSGKSSRTQPYYIPNASSSQSGRQEEQNTPGLSQLPMTSQTNTHFIIGRNNTSASISSSSQKSNESHPKAYDSQPQVPQYSSINPGIHVLPSNYPTPTPINVRQLPVQPTHAQRQTSRTSSSEVKSQKSKEDKAKTSSTSSTTAKSNSKSSHQSHHQPTSIAPAIQTTNHSAASLSQQPLRTPQTSSAQPLPKPVTQISSKVMQNSEQIDNSTNMGQTYQFHPEPFLFPDFNGGSGSRQFGTHNHGHHHSHYNQDVLHDQQEQSPSSYTQRPHPYYLPEMPSFESFAMPIQQHQPLQVTHQPTHSHTSSVGNSRQSNQNQITTKYNYAPNVQVGSSQFPIPTSESIAPQPPQQLPHTSIHLQSSSAQSQQHHPIVHHQETPTYNQQQHRGHLPEMQAVPQPLQNQVNIAQTHRHTQEPSRQQQPQPQHRSQPPASMAVSVPTSITPTSTSKSKQSQQPTMAQPFNRVVQSNQSNQTPHHLHQQHPQHQNQHQQLGVAAPSQQQQSNRSSSRTVNWMTDTAYRTSSSSSNTGNAKHRQGDGGPASNPFSVSKLVGSSSTGQSKNPQIEQQHQAPIQRPSNTTRGKTHASSSNAPGPPSNNNMNSQNQSNYCAEALIRKNPPTGGDWNDFGFGTNPSFQGYSTHHPHHHPHHSSNQNPPTADNSGYGQYQYPPSTSAHSSVTSHFTHFDYPQSQQFPTSHNNLNNSQHQQGTYHSSSTQHHQIPVPHGQHVHNTQPHSSHHQPNQLQYPNQGHHQAHHHHQSHGNTSTSSVSNFNLSTIFPEINDKRGGSVSANNSNVGIGGNSGISTSRSGGGQSSSCGYQHPGFGQQSGSGRNLHH